MSPSPMSSQLASGRDTASSDQAYAPQDPRHHLPLSLPSQQWHLDVTLSPCHSPPLPLHSSHSCPKPQAELARAGPTVNQSRRCLPRANL